ncbi:hypothetical protein DM01DRAFT_1332356, partial [Hesseltinella vesiculosa]
MQGIQPHCQLGNSRLLPPSGNKTGNPEWVKHHYTLVSPFHLQAIVWEWAIHCLTHKNIHTGGVLVSKQKAQVAPITQAL